MGGETLREQVVSYLIEKYDPEAIILYGSFENGSNNDHSDFDALIIAESDVRHDASMFGDTPLDVFIYRRESFLSDYDPADFVQIFDGRILFDKGGLAFKLKQNVLAWLADQPKKSEEENRMSLDWCKKMLERTGRQDAEGFFRWHWLLTDSLSIYYDVKGLYYFGPKKALKKMQENDPKGFELYTGALKGMDQEALSLWISYLEACL